MEGIKLNEYQFAKLSQQLDSINILEDKLKLMKFHFEDLCAMVLNSNGIKEGRIIEFNKEKKELVIERL